MQRHNASQLHQGQRQKTTASYMGGFREEGRMVPAIRGMPKNALRPRHIYLQLKRALHFINQSNARKLINRSGAFMLPLSTLTTRPPRETVRRNPLQVSTIYWKIKDRSLHPDVRPSRPFRTFWGCEGVCIPKHKWPYARHPYTCVPPRYQRTM